MKMNEWIDGTAKSPQLAKTIAFPYTVHAQNIIAFLWNFSILSV